MTLHWWMHWFWVTAQIVVSLTSPTTDRPQTDQMAISDSSVTTSIPMLESSSSVSAMPSPSPSPDSAMRLRYTETTESLPGRLQQNYRIAKAIGIQPTELVSAEPQSLRLVTTPPPDNLRSTPVTGDNKTAFEVFENKTTQPGRIPGKKESKITWVHAFSKPSRTKYEDKASSSTTTPIPIGDELLTVMPLREVQPQQIDPNAIRREHVHLPKVMAAAAASSSNNSRSGGLLLGEETPVESHAIATAASVLDANVGDSTRLGRARGTFSSEFQREQLSREEQQHRAEHKEETMKKEGTESSENVTEIATITGSCLAVIVLLSTVGSLGFIMYRRRYLNPPQTLNSDKCSNPDSSGYIDDSTIRDNSEEMYSLDNDSFLNSLEAMTIQNYWTDSVKHTKL